MMDYKRFSIEFDRPGAVFYPGQVVSGKIMLSVKRTKKVDGLLLLLKGSGQVVWYSKKFGTKHQMCMKDEVYCNIETWLKVAGQVHTLPSGVITTYPFAIVLPSVLPSSFEGQQGRVRYTAKATIFRLSKPDHTTEKDFNVEAKCDLNTNVEARLAPECMELRMLDCCWFGPLLVNMRLNKGGYVPGETILLSGIAKNRSNKAIQRVTVTLQQVIRYNQKSGGKVSSERRKTLLQKDLGRIEPRSEQTWTDVALLVPPVPQTDLGMSGGIIGVRYQLKIEVKPSYMFTKLISCLPVFIGTIPLRDSRNTIQLNPCTVCVLQPTAPPAPDDAGDSAASRPPNQLPDLPPSYSKYMREHGADLIRAKRHNATRSINSMEMEIWQQLQRRPLRQ